jgi:hypothetical protein
VQRGGKTDAGEREHDDASHRASESWASFPAAAW